MDWLRSGFDHLFSEYGAKGYEFWSQLIRGDPIVIPHPDDPKGVIEIEAEPIWNEKPQGDIRVLVSVLHTTKFGITLPTASFLVRRDGKIEHPIWE